MVARLAARTPHPTRNGGQGDGSRTNSPKTDNSEKHSCPYASWQALDSLELIAFHVGVFLDLLPPILRTFVSDNLKRF